jgi:hypothetical protein
MTTNGKIGGDRKSREAREQQAARATLADQISARFNEHVRELRHVHGDRAVDRAIDELRQQSRVMIPPRR